MFNPAGLASCLAGCCLRHHRNHTIPMFLGAPKGFSDQQLEGAESSTLSEHDKAGAWPMHRISLLL